MYSSTQAPSQDLKKHDWPPYQVSALELQRTYQLVSQLADQLDELLLGAVPLRQYSRGQSDATQTLPISFAAPANPVALIYVTSPRGGQGPIATSGPGGPTITVTQ